MVSLMLHSLTYLLWTLKAKQKWKMCFLLYMFYQKLNGFDQMFQRGIHKLIYALTVFCVSKSILLLKHGDLMVVVCIKVLISISTLKLRFSSMISIKVLNDKILDKMLFWKSQVKWKFYYQNLLFSLVTICENSKF